MNNIIWKRMIYHGKDLGDYYLISNKGEIKGVKTGKVRKKNINHEGYYFVCVSLGSRNKKPLIKIHRAVAETFLDNPNNYPVINHKDGNKLNNCVENLEFCTYQENTIHAYKNELKQSNINKKVYCINYHLEFDNLREATKWANLKSTTTIRRNINGIYNYAGRHPITKEPLLWCFK